MSSLPRELLWCDLGDALLSSILSGAELGRPSFFDEVGDGSGLTDMPSIASVKASIRRQRYQADENLPPALSLSPKECLSLFSTLLVQ